MRENVENIRVKTIRLFGEALFLISLFRQFAWYGKIRVTQVAIDTRGQNRDLEITPTVCFMQERIPIPDYCVGLRRSDKLGFC